MNKENLLKFFDKSWLEDSEMLAYLSGEKFEQIGRYLSKRRKEVIVYPESEKVFRVFKEMDYNNIKCVMIFQDPYHDGSACGHATCNCETLKISPTLRVLLQEVDLEYPENKNIIKDRLDLMDLTRWQRQGILLLNTALTVEKSNPGSHISLWEDFTSEVLKTLNKRDFLVWILFGKFAEKYEKEINIKHCILKYSHPAAEVYRKGSFVGNNCFKAINSMLKDKIIW